MFSGIYQILQTPFDEQGSIDWDSLARQIEYCIQAGVHGLVIPAMASEFFVLTDQERYELVEFSTKHIDKRVPLLAGVQGVSQQAASQFAEHAVRHGADGLMAMPPYLRKASRPEVDSYYEVLGSFGLPVMIQNAPALAGISLSPADLASLLSKLPQVQYVKEEAPPILQRISQIISHAGTSLKGAFGGANGLYLIDELRRGACGNMPAGGFVDVQVKIYNLYVAGDHAAAEALHNRLLPLLTYASAYGVSLHKYLLQRRGVIASAYVRDPQRNIIDDHDARSLERYWEAIADETMPDYPLK